MVSTAEHILLDFRCWDNVITISSSLPFPSILLDVSSTSLSLRSRPLNPSTGTGDHCKLLQRVPGLKRILNTHDVVRKSDTSLSVNCEIRLDNFYRAACIACYAV